LETILLFSRNELVHLYGKLDQELKKTMNVVHNCHSKIEKEILEQQYHVVDVIDFKHQVSKLFLNKINMSLIDEIDEVIIENSCGRFCLNSAIQSDRTFTKLAYDDCLRLAQSYYLFWKNYFEKNRVEYFLHEPTSLFFNHIACLLGRKNNVKYITLISVYGPNKHDFLIVSGDDGVAEEIELNYNQKNNLSTHKDVKQFLDNFRNNESAFYHEISFRYGNIFEVLITSFHILVSTIKKKYYTSKITDRVLDHVEYYVIHSGNTWFERLKKIWGSTIFLKYDKFLENDNYFYYPLHLEPEAVVLYWGDGLYKNQVKLIENIAAQLKPNHYLFVKEHPHAGYYRDFVDYKRIKEIPNVKLLNPYLSGKSIIKKSKGVFTISGTSGFEALLLGKPVYTFGNCFYNLFPRVKKIKNIRDLRTHLYANMTSPTHKDTDYYNFVGSYLSSIHQGFVNYFLDYVEKFNINETQNTELVALGLIEFFKLSQIAK